MNSFPIRVCLAVVCTLIACGPAAIATAEPKPADAPQLILRISRKAVGQGRQESFSHEQAVNDIVLGTTVKGVAKTSGKCSVEPCADRQGTLRIVIKGTSVTDSEGRNGPAIITSTTTTTFTAMAPLEFHHDRGFTVADMQIDATTNTETKDIQSTQKGIAGTFVKKIAAKKIQESKAQAEEIARELAVKRIRGELSRELDQRMQHVNLAYEQLRPVALLVGRSKDESTHLIAHDGDLIICIGCRSTPDVKTIPNSKADLELCLPSHAVNAKLYDQLSRATSRRTIAIVAGPHKVAATREPSNIERQGDWLMVSVATPEGLGN